MDTPGFDDSTKTDTQILMEVADWLNRAYSADVLLSGIIYLHRIIDARIGGQASKVSRQAVTNWELKFDLLSKSLRSFKRLCGEDAFRKVVLATTFWDQVNSDLGERREQELKSEWDYWREMMERGSQVLRHDQGRHSAKRILKYLIDQRRANDRPAPLAIQREMMVERKPLSQTGAGAEMMSQLERQRLEYEKRLRDLRQDLEEAIASKDKELQARIEELTKEAEAKKAQDEADKQKLDADNAAMWKLLIETKEQENTNRVKDEEQQEQIQRRLKFALAQVEEQQGFPKAEKEELLQELEKQKRKVDLLRWKIDQSRALCLMM